MPFDAEDSLPQKTAEEVSAEMRDVLNGHKSIKIGGSGEPTQRPGQLRFLAETAKAEGGYVIVDTNGSRPDVILPLVERGLVDQVEVGLKGFTGEEAARRSGTGDRRLSWDNPLRLIRTIVSDHPAAHVFPTFVVDADAGQSGIRRAFDLFSHNVSSKLYLRFDTMIDPVQDMAVMSAVDYVLGRPVMDGKIVYRVGPTIEKFGNELVEVLFEALQNDSFDPSDDPSALDTFVRSFLHDTYYPGFNFKPADSAQMIAMIAGVAHAYPEYGDRVIIVSKREAKYGEDGLVRLWLQEGQRQNTFS